jgi:ABC-type sugar transport system ATPase subunit
MIRFHQICWSTKSFVINDISFAIETGNYGVLMGKTGTGKTSLLEILCGLRHPDSGSVFIGDRDVTLLEPGQRRIGYVPQDGALFPTLTVEEHLAFAPRIAKATKTQCEHLVHRIAGQLSIHHLLNRRPHGLSGGERQRVALGRALAAQPEALILDEPLSALDDETREGLLPVLKSLSQRDGITVLHITHHREEARILADQLLTLKDGQVSSVSPDLLDESR